MKFDGFQITNFRNVIDSGWINVNQITAFVGQNEAGKSNLFEALYCVNPIIEGAHYNANEDWPVDDWAGRKDASGVRVCHARFSLTTEEIAALASAASAAGDDATGEEEPNVDGTVIPLPENVHIDLYSAYDRTTGFYIAGFPDGSLDEQAAEKWARENVPKFVYIHDYDMSGAEVELTQLRDRWYQVGRKNRHLLSNEDQTILIILDLASINIDDFLRKGETSEGRTIRSFDKRSASAYLTQQFSNLWRQKDVKFDIEIDGPTLNIFAEDVGIGMPVRLKRRSTGFRWYVSFAWKFTHATNGDFKDCVLLLEEPGVHLHFSGQRDLLTVFERLAEHNTILYTTHLASMVDQAYPERVRIIESKDGHVAVTQGIVSSQRAPMAVIEQSLGLTGDHSGIFGSRQVLIVEGGGDAVVLQKLSGLLKSAGKEGLSDRIHLWPADGASKTPMYAGFAIGQGWDAGVLLDSDEAGNKAKAKIDELYISQLAANSDQKFRTLMLGKISGTRQTDFAIEDLFPPKFFIDCVNETYGIAIKAEDLSEDGSDMISKRVESVLKSKYGHDKLDKKRVMAEMWKQFDSWKSIDDLPAHTAARAEKVFKAINEAFAK